MAKCIDCVADDCWRAGKNYEMWCDGWVENMPAIKPTIFARTNSIRTQIKQLASKLAEVRMALVDYEAGGSIDALVDELEDVKISATTAQKILGYDAKDRQEVYRRVVAKNKERGYYGED